MRQPLPPALSAPPRQLPQKRPRAPASTPPPVEQLRRPTLVPWAHSDNEAPPEAPRQLVPPDLGKVDLLPRGVLRRLSEEDPGAGPDGAQRPERDVSRQAATARLAQQRVQGFIESDLAKEQARSGFIDPVWRDLEASVHDLFKPPEALVRSGSSSMTVGERLGNQISSLTKQVLGSPGRVEPGTLPRGEFAERGPMGLPENMYRNGLAAQQSKAAVDAWKKPATWRRTEVELVTTAAGEVESVRVISTCGVKKLDELAVQTIKKAARGVGGKHTVTTWAFESGYAANSPVISAESATGAPTVMIGGGFNFDETGLGRKNAHGSSKYLSDPQYLIGGNGHTRVLLLSLRELQE